VAEARDGGGELAALLKKKRVLLKAPPQTGKAYDGAGTARTPLSATPQEGVTQEHLEKWRPVSFSPRPKSISPPSLLFLRNTEPQSLTVWSWRQTGIRSCSGGKKSISATSLSWRSEGAVRHFCIGSIERERKRRT